MPAIIPPYLLARVAATGAPHMQHAAAAARKTLALTPSLRVIRSRLRLSIDESGSLVAERTPAPDRTVSDCAHTTDLPGRTVRREDDPPAGDPAADQAFDGLGITFDFFQQAYARDGIDGQGAPLLASVHYDRDYDNAFWDGTQMVFGDGDGEVFTGFTGSLTVIAHELAHGVTEASGGLDYQGQSGALNESLSDVFGCLAEQFHLDQTADEASWLVGEGIFTDAVQGVALRSMKAPGTAYDDDVLGKDPQPATMAGYVETEDDNGGVHINSGIPNRAFFLVATALGGRAWERAGLIWYRTLTAGLDSTTDFAAFVRATLATAAREYGEDSEEVDAVREGWRGVGLAEDDGS